MVIRLRRVVAVAALVVLRARTRAAALLEMAGAALVVGGVDRLSRTASLVVAGLALLLKALELDVRGER